MVSHEIVAGWFLRLNGFLATPNFIVHPDQAGNQITEVDLLGVRFPHRRELPQNPMPDCFPSPHYQHLTYFILGEVKSGRCAINRVLADRRSDALERVLSAVGALTREEALAACHSIWDIGHFANSGTLITHVCFGREIDERIQESFPAVPQVLWQDALGFIYDRFAEFRGPKGDHPQWDESGRFLWSAAARSDSRERFVDFIEQDMAIRSSA